MVADVPPGEANKKEMVAGVESLIRVTGAEPDAEPSALVAVIVSACPDGMEAGAVYNPALVRAPTDGLLELQLTFGLDEPETNAENCWLWEALNETAEGLTVTATAA